MSGDVLLWREIPETERDNYIRPLYPPPPDGEGCEAAVPARGLFRRCQFRHLPSGTLCSVHQEQYDAWTAIIRQLTGRAP
jgi:hypothetical protein